MTEHNTPGTQAPAKEPSGAAREFGGFVALLLGLWMAYRYDGSWDATIAGITNLGLGTAHIVGMALVALLVYLGLFALSLLLGRIARLPILGTGNALAGAALGIVKAAIFSWAVLYIALFFPLTPELRSDLGRSQLVAIITQYNAEVDAFIVRAMPSSISPFVEQLISHHRV